MTPSPARFVVVEGIDGTGKTTLVAELRRRLDEAGIPCLASREPTDSPAGRRIREIAREGRDRTSPEAELELFLEDRRAHVADTILPALAAGRVVLLDRYYYSTMAYQGARGLDPAAIEARHRGFAPEPDLLVLLELDPRTALDRVTRSRGDVPDAFERLEDLERTAAIFASIRRPNLLRLDARRPTDESVEAVMEAAGWK